MHPLIIKTKYGNRHLKHTDKECECFGMSDMMYKSVKMSSCNDMYDLEFVNGVYWDESSNDFSDLCSELYKLRLAYKKDNNVLELAVKKILNSLYGVLLEKMSLYKD